MKQFPADQYPIDELPDVVPVRSKPHHKMHEQLHRNVKALMVSIPSHISELEGVDEFRDGTPGQPRYSGNGTPNPADYPDAVLGRDLYLDRDTGLLYLFR